MSQDRPDVEQVLGYCFSDAALLDEALTHASVADHRLDSNERMEFLGDAVLGLVVSDYLCAEFPKLLEGELTKIKGLVVSRRTCAKVAHAMGLVSMMNLGKGMHHGDLPSSVAAAVLESVIAAIYLDGGLEPARRFILDAMIPHITAAAESAHQQNFKSVLQQYAQRQVMTNPAYITLDEKGPDHSKCFEMCVEIDGRRFASAWAGSKKQAEQKAALLALEELQLVKRNGKGQVILVEPDRDDDDAAVVGCVPEAESLGPEDARR